MRKNYVRPSSLSGLNLRWMFRQAGPRVLTNDGSCDRHGDSIGFDREVSSSCSKSSSGSLPHQKASKKRIQSTPLVLPTAGFARALVLLRARESRPATRIHDKHLCK